MALSAYDDRATVLEMLEAGAIGYLVKGCSIDADPRGREHAAPGRRACRWRSRPSVIGELAGQLNGDAARASARSGAARAHPAHARATDGSLEIVFQPICAPRRGGAVGAEALSRFPSPPRRGPEQWFEEAEAVGLRRELELARDKARSRSSAAA